MYVTAQLKWQQMNKNYVQILKPVQIFCLIMKETVRLPCFLSAKTNKHSFLNFSFSQNVSTLSDFSSQKFIYCHFSNPKHKSAGPRLSADFGTHATRLGEKSEGWTEPEKEERTESAPLSPMVTESPQLPMNGMMGCNSEHTALVILGYGVTSFSDGNP